MTICRERLVSSQNQSCMYLAFVIPWGTSVMVVNLNLSFTVNYPFFLTTTKKRFFFLFIRWFTSIFISAYLEMSVITSIMPEHSV